MFQERHALLPTETHDEAARCAFVSSLRKMFTTELFPGMRTVYQQRQRPLFEKKHAAHRRMSARRARAPDPFDNLLTSWFGDNANEPFSAGFKALDYDQAFDDAGFKPENVVRGTREPVYLKGQLPPISFIGAIRK